MAEPLIPYLSAPELPLGFLQYIPLLGELVDPADPPSIKPFGTLVALGVYVGSVVALRRGRRRGYDEKMMADALFWVVAAGFIGGHVLDAVFYHPRTVLRDPLYLVKLWDGLSSYGGFAGSIIGAFAWIAYRRRPVLHSIDVIVGAFPLAWVFGRAGCAVVHDHPGMLSDAWFAVRFPAPGGGWVGRYDLGLYECLLTIPLAVVCAVLWRRRLWRPVGFYIAVTCTAYPPMRFLLDFLRAGPQERVLGADPRYGGLTPAQWACFGLFGLGLYFVWRVRRAGPAVARIDPARRPAPPPPEQEAGPEQAAEAAPTAAAAVEPPRGAEPDRTPEPERGAARAAAVEETDSG
ncbi:MAG: prolipoprotein diacylglyceryl transferase [Deltaproteobacteria bacterium]|nr:prolipoprotein diacylglyceryl transferase [Deltaproteobacteria bacterium]